MTQRPPFIPLPPSPPRWRKSCTRGHRISENTHPVYADRHYMSLTADWPQAYPWTGPAPSSHNPLYAVRHYMYLTAGWAKPYPWTCPAPTNHNPLRVAPPTRPHMSSHSPHAAQGALHRQIPALAPKLQSSLIILGPRKAAVRRPQHGYKKHHI